MSDGPAGDGAGGKAVRRPAHASAPDDGDPAGDAGPDQPAPGGAPRVTVVIPVMGHPVLVDDAIASAAVLMDRGEVARIVVVNDGCRFAETRASLASWAAALGRDRLTVVPQANAGLSAARNAGIEVALADPAGAPDAIFLLDADNRLARGAGRAFAALLRDHPDGDWFYPPFDFFGQNGHYAGETQPSALMHGLVNHSEAGSLVRTRVFASGLRFAEDMRQGYEDWDFFLAATGRGFRGLPANRPLLEYRRRPASMLAHAHEVDTQLRALLRQRHPWLFSAAAILAREAEGFPRYALIAEPGGPTLVGSDPAQMTQWPAGHLERAIVRHLSAPLRHHAPPFLVFLPDALRERLMEAGVLRGILWAIERRFAREPGYEVAGVTLTGSEDSFAWTDNARAGGTPMILALGPAVVERAARSGRPPRSAALLQGDAFLAGLTLPAALIASAGPQIGDGAAQAAHAFLQQLAAHPGRGALTQPWDWRETGGARSRADALSAARLATGGGVLLPFTDRAPHGLDIGFTVPIFDQGGVEKVVLQLVRVLKAAGHACHLFVIGGRPAHLGRDERGLFSSINFLADNSASDWSGREFMGTAEPSWGNEQERADLVGLLQPMDLVIDAHAAAVHKVATALRRGGTRMADHEHLLEISQYGRAYGPPILALAYEHAYDRIMTCSAGLAHWLAAHGVPREKLMPLVNAPGYALPPEAVTAALAGRPDPAAARPLSVLYLGRLDQQKGIDRVAAVFDRLAAIGASGGPQFRLTTGGRAVVGTAAPVDWPAGTRVLGTVDGAAALTAAFTAADILILPSRYEGLPLVLLEAQRLGCVPIATDVGAVAEAITDGETGFLVSEDGAVEAMTAHILALDADRDRLARMSRTAAARSRTWEEAAAPLLDWCREIMAARRPLTGPAP